MGQNKRRIDLKDDMEFIKHPFNKAFKSIMQEFTYSNLTWEEFLKANKNTKEDENEKEVE